MSIVKVNRIEQVENTDLPTNLTPVTASAWVNFNGTGVVSIRDSHNVSSVTDNGTGNYTVNFANNLSDINYTVVQTCNLETCRQRDVSNSVSATSIISANASGTSTDAANVNVVVFGGRS